jgi:hypothetical protein
MAGKSLNLKHVAVFADQTRDTRHGHDTKGGGDLWVK